MNFPRGERTLHDNNQSAFLGCIFRNIESLRGWQIYSVQEACKARDRRDRVILANATNVVVLLLRKHGPLLVAAGRGNVVPRYAIKSHGNDASIRERECRANFDG